MDTGATIDLGAGRTLTAYYSPGHAKHHIGLVDSATGDLYVGDAAGMYNPYTGDVRPATPPPDFNLAAALDSLRLFSDIKPQRLMFSHFGAVSDVEPVLERSVEELRLWVETVRESHSTAGDLDHAVALVRERVRERYRPLPDEVPQGTQEVLEILCGEEGNVSGIMHWLDVPCRSLPPRRPNNSPFYVSARRTAAGRAQPNSSELTGLSFQPQGAPLLGRSVEYRVRSRGRAR